MIENKLSALCTTLSKHDLLPMNYSESKIISGYEEHHIQKIMAKLIFYLKKNNDVDLHIIASCIELVMVLSEEYNVKPDNKLVIKLADIISDSELKNQALCLAA